MSEIKLAKPDIEAYETDGFDYYRVTGYTADQMRAAILEERDKWQKDAERYRWIASVCESDGHGYWLTEICVKEGALPPNKHEVDAAIDAAIRSK